MTYQAFACISIPQTTFREGVTLPGLQTRKPRRAILLEVTRAWKRLRQP